MKYIVGQDIVTNVSILQNIKTSQYAWNRCSIDKTDALCCAAAVGRDFKIPLYVDIGAASTRDDNNQSILSKYLQYLSNNWSFSISVLQVLIDK